MVSKKLRNVISNGDLGGESLPLNENLAFEIPTMTNLQSEWEFFKSDKNNKKLIHAPKEFLPSYSRRCLKNFAIFVE